MSKSRENDRPGQVLVCGLTLDARPGNLHLRCRSAVAAASLAMAFAFQPPAASAAQPALTPRDICITRLEATASSQHHHNRYFRAANAIDGNAQSRWESARDKLPKEPQYITIELDTLRVVDALRYFVEGRGRITDYEIQVSSDGKQFTSVAAGQWDPQGPPEERVAFAPVEACQVRLIAKSATGNVAIARQITLESPHPPPPVAVVVPSAAEAEARRAAFAARQSPENLENIADQLSRFLRIDAPELTVFADRYRQGDIAGALQAFNLAFAARLVERRELLEDMPFLQTGGNPRTASLLLANIVKTSDGRFMDLGKPGTIDWDNSTAFANSPQVEMFNL